MASDNSMATMQPTSQPLTGAAKQSPLNAELPTQPPTSVKNQAPINAELMAEPAYGTAPLTVDFSVILADSPLSLTYQWNFGDGAVSSLPFAAYLPHVYQRPGTYWCSLTLMSSAGRAATVFTPVVVLPRQS
jgi:PKD repeat protein